MFPLVVYSLVQFGPCILQAEKAAWWKDFMDQLRGEHGDECPEMQTDADSQAEKFSKKDIFFPLGVLFEQLQHMCYKFLVHRNKRVTSFY